MSKLSLREEKHTQQGSWQGDGLGTPPSALQMRKQRLRQLHECPRFIVRGCVQGGDGDPRKAYKDKHSVSAQVVALEEFAPCHCSDLLNRPRTLVSGSEM